MRFLDVLKRLVKAVRLAEDYREVVENGRLVGALHESAREIELGLLVLLLHEKRHARSEIRLGVFGVDLQDRRAVFARLDEVGAAERKPKSLVGRHLHKRAHALVVDEPHQVLHGVVPLVKIVRQLLVVSHACETRDAPGDRRDGTAQSRRDGHVGILLRDPDDPRGYGIRDRYAALGLGVGKALLACNKARTSWKRLPRPFPELEAELDRGVVHAIRHLASPDSQEDGDADFDRGAVGRALLEVPRANVLFPRRRPAHHVQRLHLRAHHGGDQLDAGVEPSVCKHELGVAALPHGLDNRVMDDGPQLRLDGTVYAEHRWQNAYNDDHLDKIAHNRATRLCDLERAVVLVEEEYLLAAKREARGGKRERDSRHKHEHAFEEVGVYLDGTGGEGP